MLPKVPVTLGVPLTAIAAGDGLRAPQRVENRLLDAVGAGAKKRVHALIGDERRQRNVLREMRHRVGRRKGER